MQLCNCQGRLALRNRRDCCTSHRRATYGAHQPSTEYYGKFVTNSFISVSWTGVRLVCVMLLVTLSAPVFNRKEIDIP